MSNNSSQSPKRVVYTAVFGNYETLLEQPLAVTSPIDFICFTDDPGLTSTTWEIRVVDARRHLDSVRNARSIKVLGHTQLDSYDETMWIDNRILLRRDPQDFFSEWLGEDDMALPVHPTRPTLREEFGAVLRHNFDQPFRVRSLLAELTQNAPELLGDKPYWSAILLRQNNHTVQRTMRVWLDLILLHSRRDQLSLNYALALAPMNIAGITVSAHGSEWIEWLDVTRVARDPRISLATSWRYPFYSYALDVLRRSRYFGRAERRVRKVR